MLKKKIWLPILIVLLAMIGCGLFYARQVSKQAPVKVYKVVEVEEPKTPKPPPPGETSESGHWKPGDEWHSQPHETHETPAVSAGQSYIPEGVATTPNFPPVDANADPVEEAYKRLEYIKNNLYAWGGVHSERATELIAKLMPPPVLIDHDHGDTLHQVTLELIAENDPRAAEVIIANMCDGYFGSVNMFEGLENIGPPAVPYILPYLEKGVREGGRIRLAVFESLERIGVRYRSDLGGIVDHIIIPKLELIVADEGNVLYDHATFIDAKYTLEQLER